MKPSFFLSYTFRLILCLCVLGVAVPARAQYTFVSLHSFTAQNGTDPDAGLVQGRDGNFYGATTGGGTFGDGTIFRLTPSGTLTTLVNFTGINGNGSVPISLIQGSDGNFYGVTEQGGSSNDGTVFQMLPSGAITTLVTFTGANGAIPAGGLVQGSDGNFYGTTQQGGSSSDYGTVFQMSPSGAITTLVTFTELNGAYPSSSLVQGSDGYFYGTTKYGGSSAQGSSGQGVSGYGTVFKVSPTGGLTTLVNFTSANGSYPSGLLPGTDGNFYGTTLQGGSFLYGTIFEVTPSGALTTLVNFNSADGAFPTGNVILGSDGDFYGTTDGGGPSNVGTVFKSTLSGAVTTIADFTFAGGMEPSNLVLDGDGNLYGTAGGGVSGNGIAFKSSSSGILTTLTEFDSTNPLGSFDFRSGDGNFYGTSYDTGTSERSTIFEMTPMGALTTFVNFTGTSGFSPAGLIQGSDGNFYGTTKYGGSTFGMGGQGLGYGAVFQMTPAGTLTTLHNFAGPPNDGAVPYAGPVEGTDGNFYGTTTAGGSAGSGTVYKVSSSGVYSILYNFSDDSNFSNQDGAFATGLMLGSDGNFYGATYEGGPHNGGVIFKITPSGALTPLVYLTYATGSDPSLLMQGNDGNFYGTTFQGGSPGYGTVFQLTPSGLLTTLANFNGANGMYPNSVLVQDLDGNIYGTTPQGGTAGQGTIFGLFGPPTVYGASETVLENTPLAFMVAFDDPSGTGVTSIAFPVSPKHGTLSVGKITETGMTGTVALTYTPATNYHSADSLSYTVTGYTGTSAQQSVTFGVSAAPQTVTGFTPASGPIGTVVAISGTDLNNVTVVRFHNANAKIFSANASGTQMTVTVPTGAGSGTITLTTLGGSVKTVTAFTVASPPTITAFSPKIGPVGSTLTLAGTNLSGVTAVRFHNASAKTFSANAQGTQLTVTVPSGAATGTITVTTPGGSVKTTTPFTVN